MAEFAKDAKIAKKREGRQEKLSFFATLRVSSRASRTLLFD